MQDGFTKMLLEIGLLKKYINHVSQCEGISFIDKCNDGMGSDVVFTEAEIKHLKALETEIDNERN